MSQLARLLGVFAPGHALEYAGKTYVFGRIDQTAKARLEALYFKRQRETLYAIKGDLSEQEFDRQLGRITDAYSAGEYAFPLGKSLEWFAGNGIAQLVEVMTGCSPAEAEALCDDRWQETYHVVWCVMAESQGGALKKKLLASEAAGGQGSQAVRLLAQQLALTNGNGRTPASAS